MGRFQVGEEAIAVHITESLLFLIGNICAFDNACFTQTRNPHITRDPSTSTLNTLLIPITCDATQSIKPCIYTPNELCIGSFIRTSVRQGLREDGR